MVWCSYCAKDQEAEADDINGFTCCTGCGRVLDDNIYSSDPTFTKGADGQSSVQGSFVRDRQYSSYNVGGEGHQYATDSHERTLEKGRDEIRDIADFLAMSSREDTVNAAHRLYVIAVERNFTRGRRTNQVAAACLYIICRQEQKPFLLIDFSDCLQTNVYVLGAVFLQLCRLLSLEQHPIMQKPVDPSLFIHRFTDRLLRKTSVEGKRNTVAQTALRLVASMKRDWIQTGRRPSGICGAALFISAHIHGFECTKTDVVSVVHICESTLTRRLIEFENTESGSLTAEEFEARAEEFQSFSQAPKSTCGDENEREVLCEHKEQGASHFAVGLCKNCFDEFIRVSGGIYGGSAPPAFQASEKKKIMAENKKLQEQGSPLDGGNLNGLKLKQRKNNLNGKAKSQTREVRDDQPVVMRGQLSDIAIVKGKRTPRKRKGVGETGRGGFSENEAAAQPSEQIDVSSNQETSELSLSDAKQNDLINMDKRSSKTEADNVSERVSLHFEERKVDDYGGGQGSKENSLLDSDRQKAASDEAERTTACNATDAFLNDFTDAADLDELARREDTLSDIDDDEVDGYLHNQEEVRLKTIIWTEMNKEYLEAQHAKQEALAASQAAHAAALAAAGADSASAVELAAAAAAAVAELKKDRKRKRSEDKSKAPAESATEATRQMLQSKRLSSKVNYSALETLFDGEVISEATKKVSEDIKENGKNKDEKKEKHVQWADTDVANELGDSRHDMEVSTSEPNAAVNVSVAEGEDEEEDEDDDDTVNLEDDQNYGLPYGEDYGDDGYDEY